MPSRSPRPSRPCRGGLEFSAAGVALDSTFVVIELVGYLSISRIDVRAEKSGSGAPAEHHDLVPVPPVASTPLAEPIRASSRTATRDRDAAL